jgi:hypothetical protein
MPHLLISFELRDPVRQAALVVAAIEDLGPATKLLRNSWFVCSELSAEDAASGIHRLMQPEDVLFVLDVPKKVAAMFNVDDAGVSFLMRHLKQCGVLDGVAPAVSSKRHLPPQRDVSAAARARGGSEHAEPDRGRQPH